MTTVTNIKIVLILGNFIYVRSGSDDDIAY